MDIELRECRAIADFHNFKFEVWKNGLKGCHLILGLDNTYRFGFKIDKIDEDFKDSSSLQFYCKSVQECNKIFNKMRKQLERRNSKGRSGHFLTNFTKNFCRFLTPKVKNGTDMINPSIESSDFLFWHEKNFGVEFFKILWETDKLNFIF